MKNHMWTVVGAIVGSLATLLVVNPEMAYNVLCGFVMLITIGMLFFAYVYTESNAFEKEYIARKKQIKQESKHFCGWCQKELNINCWQFCNNECGYKYYEYGYKHYQDKHYQDKLCIQEKYRTIDDEWQP